MESMQGEGSREYFEAKRSMARMNIGQDGDGETQAEEKRSSRRLSQKQSDMKDSISEIQQEIEVDEEFERLKQKPADTTPMVSKNQIARNFVNGFKIIAMRMSDGDSRRLLWSSNWGSRDIFEDELIENVPKEILQCKVVTREIEFSCSEELKNFRLEQRIYLHGNCIEEWLFSFGFVIPGSTNTWQQTIYAATEKEMIPHEVLSGNIVFETKFFDEERFLCKNSVRINYV